MSAFVWFAIGLVVGLFLPALSNAWVAYERYRAELILKFLEPFK
jgi:hypothetical protein